MTGAAPRVIIISDEQWARAGLRAELREHGYDAIGATDIEHAERYVTPDPHRGPVKLVIVDQAAADARTIDTLERWRTALGARVLLLAHATRDVPSGPWDEIVRRPVSIGDLEERVRALMPLAEADRKSVDVK